MCFNVGSNRAKVERNIVSFFPLIAVHAETVASSSLTLKMTNSQQ